MAASVAAFLIATAFLTATLSGIFGMAGGLVLMGALALVLPVSAAFVTHGILQLVANGWRAVLHRQHVSWPILINYAIASAAAGAVLALVSFAPSKPLLFLLLGLVPMLDIFFVRTELTRHQIVATKAATQVFSHLAKILVYGTPLFAAGKTTALPPLWVFALAIPASMLGTGAGGWVLDRMSDTNFKRWTAWIVTAIGAAYLLKSASLWS